MIQGVETGFTAFLTAKKKINEGHPLNDGFYCTLDVSDFLKLLRIGLTTVRSRIP
jgi:hypothetical protein